MADKSTIEAIEKLKAARPRQLLDSMMSLGEMPSPTMIANGLRFLVEDFRAQATLVMDSGARGKGADATALRTTASTLSLLADAVERVNLDAVEPTPARVYAPIEWCGSNENHMPHDYERQGEMAGEAVRHQLHCDGPRAPRDMSGLDKLVNDSITRPLNALQDDGAVHAGEVAPVATFTFAEPGDQREFDADQAELLERDSPLPVHQVVVMFAGEQQQVNVREGDTITSVNEHEQMRAYLAGETNTMPGDAPTPPPAGLPAEFPVHATERGPVTDPEILKAAAVLEPAPAAMFAEPAAVARPADVVMPGRRLTFAELRKPAPVPVVLHTSNSQVAQMNDCGLQGRLSRYEPGVIERPAWANVGGKTLHRVAEEFERMVLEVKNPQFVADRVKVAGGAAGLWSTAFMVEIIAQVMLCPQVPQVDWRASGRGGAEGYTWWLTCGPDMVRRYLDLRLAELANPNSRVIMGAQGGAAMIEHEGALDVEGTPHKLVIDQVWRRGNDAVMIDDVKSGASAPRGGTFQLAQYAWWLRREYGYTGKIYGRYWNARTGEYSAPVDLIELHPWDEIVWRIKDAQAKKEAGLFGANPGPFCGGCPVKHACPVVTRG